MVDREANEQQALLHLFLYLYYAYIQSHRSGAAFMRSSSLRTFPFRLYSLECCSGTATTILPHGIIFGLLLLYGYRLTSSVFST